MSFTSAYVLKCKCGFLPDLNGRVIKYIGRARADFVRWDLRVCDMGKRAQVLSTENTSDADRSQLWGHGPQVFPEGNGLIEAGPPEHNLEGLTDLGEQ